MEGWWVLQLAGRAQCGKCRSFRTFILPRSGLLEPIAEPDREKMPVFVKVSGARRHDRQLVTSAVIIYEQGQKPMKHFIQTILITVGLIIVVSIFSCSEDNNVFQIRLVHPDNDKLIENKNLEELTGYEKYTFEPPDWPPIIWVSKQIDLNISDLESVTLEFSKPLVSKEAFNTAKKQNPDSKVSDDFEKAFTDGGQPQMELNFNPEGTRKLAQLTTTHVNQRISIFLDGRLVSAPKIMDPITKGKARLTSALSVEQAGNLVEKINNHISANSN